MCSVVYVPSLCSRINKVQSPGGVGFRPGPGGRGRDAPCGPGTGHVRLGPLGDEAADVVAMFDV